MPPSNIMFLRAPHCWSQESFKSQPRAMQKWDSANSCRIVAVPIKINCMVDDICKNQKERLSILHFFVVVAFPAARRTHTSLGLLWQTAYELRDSVVMSPLRVSVDASEMEPASEDDMIWEVSPLVVAELFPDEVLRCLGWNSVMMTVTLFTVTALCWAVLLSTFFNLGLETKLDIMQLQHKYTHQFL